MIHLFSRAKINIGLRIVGQRPDGYHNLESIFQEISLADEVFVRRRESGIRIRSNLPDLPTDEQNLCWRAFDIFKREFGINEGVEIELLKNIPPGTGLGGGSSNAAACLKGFSRLFGQPASLPALLRMAARIGSDVPFFILGKTALVKGRGEVVIPISFLRDYQCLIIFPEIRISTAFIYKNFQLSLTKYKPDVKFDALIFRVKTLRELGTYFPNDLEAVAQKFYPELKKIGRMLSESGAQYQSLSGSGSAVYGLFEENVDLYDVRERFFKQYQTYIAKPVF